MLLQISSVSKAFNGITALSDISLTISESESVGIIGPNGSGKTTLFNVISGFVVPDSGELHFRGSDLLRVPPHKIPSKGIARMFQIPRLCSSLTVLENVAVGMYQDPGRLLQFRPGTALRNWKVTLDVEKAISAASIVGITQRLNAFPNSLTSFERRKIELARALVVRPKLLLLDEPTSGFSRSERDAFADLVHQLASFGISMLVIEHDLTLINKTCKRVLVLDAGRKIAEGEPEVISRNKAVSDIYVGPLHAASC